jgi:lysozyme
VGMYTIADYQRFVRWLRETDPKDLYVDWGLGTCPKP